MADEIGNGANVNEAPMSEAAASNVVSSEGSGWDDVALTLATEEQLMARLAALKDARRKEYADKKKAIVDARDKAVRDAHDEYEKAINALNSDKRYADVAEADFEPDGNVYDGKATDAATEAAVLKRLTEAYPNTVTAKGFADALKVKPTHLTKVTNRLLAQGRIVKVGVVPGHSWRLAIPLLNQKVTHSEAEGLATPLIMGKGE